MRYEADFEVLSSDKELLNSQLTVAQNELLELRASRKKNEHDLSVNRGTSHDSFAQRSTEGFDSSCIMGEQSIGASTSNIDVDEMDFQSLPEDSLLSTQDNPAENQSKDVQENSDSKLVEREDLKMLQQQLEQQLMEATDKLRVIQEEIAVKNVALEESSLSLEEAQTTIATLKQSLEEKQTLTNRLGEANDQVQELHRQSETLTNELTATLLSLEGARNTVSEISEEKLSLENRLVETSQQLKRVREELENAVHQVTALKALERKSDDKPLEDELTKAMETVKSLQAEIDLKTSEISTTQDSLLQAQGRLEELEQASFDRDNLRKQVERLTSQLETLEEAVESKNRQLVAAQEFLEQQASLQQQVLQSEREKCQFEINQAQELRIQLDSTSVELEEFRAKAQELKQMCEQHQTNFKNAQANVESLNYELNKAKSHSVQQDSQKDSQAEIDSLQLALQAASTKFDQLLLSKEEIRLQFNESQYTILKLEQELSDKTSALLAASQEAAEERQRFGEQINIQEENLRKLENVLEDVRAEKKRLNSLYEALRSESDETASRVRELVKELEKEAETRSAIQHSLVEVTNQAKAKENQAIADREKLENQLQDALERVAQLTHDFERLSSELNAARAEVLTLEEANLQTCVPKEDLTALETKWRNTLEQVAKLERNIDEKTVLLETAQQNSESLQSRLHNLEQSAASYLTEKAINESTIDDLSAKNQCLGEKIEKLQSELLVKDEELSNLRTVASKIVELEAKLKLSDEEMSTLSFALEQKTDEARTMEEELGRISGSQHGREEQFRYLEEKLRERQVELDRVRSSLEAMQTTNDLLVSQLGDKENLNTELRRSFDSITQRFDMVRKKLESLQLEKMSLSSLVQQLQDELDGRRQELNDLRGATQALQQERELSSQLKQRVATLQADKEAAVAQCEKLLELRTQLLESQDNLRVEARNLKVQVDSLTEARDLLNEMVSQHTSQRETILKEYQQQKQALSEAESQLEAVQSQRDEYLTQTKMLSDQVTDLRSRTASYESSSKHQVQRQLEDTVETLKRELRDANSNIEVITLNFETEEDGLKKKIERLEKELEAMKQQVKF